MRAARKNEQRQEQWGRLAGVELFRGFFEGAGGGGLPVGFDFVFLLADGFEEGVAGDVDAGFGDLPEAGSDFAALDVEGASFAEFAEEAVAEFDVVGEGSAEGADAVVGL